MDSNKNDDDNLHELLGYTFKKRNPKSGIGHGFAIYVKMVSNLI